MLNSQTTGNTKPNHRFRMMMLTCEFISGVRSGKIKPSDRISEKGAALNVYFFMEKHKISMCVNRKVVEELNLNNPTVRELMEKIKPQKKSQED